MSGALQALLGSQDPLFASMLERLERASGSEGRDIRLLSDIAARARANTLALGLSPHDLLGRELYAALLVKVAESNAYLMAQLKLMDTSSHTEVQGALIHFAEQVTAEQPVLALKHPTAKKMLKAVPPRGLMKQLGYRSVDSFLKHETVENIYAIAGFFEDEVWAQRHFAQFEHLTATDFEQRPPVFFRITDRYVRGGVLPHALPEVVCAPLMGAIGVNSHFAAHPQAVIADLLLLLEGAQECAAFSTYMAHVQFQSDFGQRLVKVLRDSKTHAGEMAGIQVPFYAVHRHTKKFVAEATEGMQTTHSAAALLALHDEAFRFWANEDYVGQVYEDGVVTFNLSDLAHAYRHALSYEQFQTPHFERALWHELIARYLSVDALRRQVLGSDLV